MKKIILALTLAVLMIACFAPAVMAAKPDSVGKPDKAEKITGKLDQVLDATPLEADVPEGDEIAPTKGKPDKEAKINQGKLMSTVTKVRQEQFKLTKEQLKEMGYKGSMSDFATSYNTAMNGLKAEVRSKMQVESEFTTTVVRNLMERELAQIREGLIKGMTVVDEELAGDVTEAIEEIASEEVDIEEIEAALEEEIPYMDEEFKAELLLTATVGTEEEKEALAEQLEEFVEETTEEIAPPVLDVEEIREDLEAAESIHDEEVVEEDAVPAEDTPAEEALDDTTVDETLTEEPVAEALPVDDAVVEPGIVEDIAEAVDDVIPPLEEAEIAEEPAPEPPAEDTTPEA